MLIHATAVAIGGRAVLLMGPSGSGKSDLALRLIDRGAMLIADDQVRLARAGDGLTASAPPSIAGRMEVRGVGIVPVSWRDGVPVALLVDLEAPPARLPTPGTRELLACAVPVIALAAREASAPIKVELALRALVGGVEAAR